MKFTKPNENGILCNKFFNSHSEAVEHFGSGIIPVVTLDEWATTPKDYKGKVDGKSYILYLTDNGITYSECAIVYGL